MKPVRDALSHLRDEQLWLMTASLLVLAAAAIGAVLYFTRSFMIPFVLSLFIASLVAPVVDYQVVRLRWPKWVAVTTALLLVAIVMSLFCFTILIALQTVLREIQTYQDALLAFIQNQLNEVAKMEVVQRFNIEVDTNYTTRAVRAQLPQVATQGASWLVGLIIDTGLTGIFVAFLLAGRNSHRARKGIYAEVDQKVRKYIVTKVGISALTGILVWFSLYLIGLDLAPLFGILAFLLNFIPSIGSIISTMLPIPIAVIQYESLWPMIGAVALPGSVQMTLGNVVEPKLMGVGLELHPATILLSLAFWGLIWGPIGMVLAVPITAVLRIILVRFESTRPAADLLAGKLPEQ